MLVLITVICLSARHVVVDLLSQRSAYDDGPGHIYSRDNESTNKQHG